MVRKDQPFEWLVDEEEPRTMIMILIAVIGWFLFVAYRGDDPE